MFDSCYHITTKCDLRMVGIRVYGENGPRLGVWNSRHYGLPSLSHDIDDGQLLSASYQTKRIFRGRKQISIQSILVAVYQYTLCLQVFYYTHMLYWIFYIVMILHAQHFWKWFLVPGIIYILERILRSQFVKLARYGHTYILEGILLPSKVTINQYDVVYPSP